MVDMPEEWKGGIDTAQFGRYVAQQEQGRRGQLLRKKQLHKTTKQGTAFRAAPCFAVKIKLEEPYDPDPVLIY